MYDNSKVVVLLNWPVYLLNFILNIKCTKINLKSKINLYIYIEKNCFRYQTTFSSTFYTLSFIGSWPKRFFFPSQLNPYVVIPQFKAKTIFFLPSSIHSSVQDQTIKFSSQLNSRRLLIPQSQDSSLQSLSSKHYKWFLSIYFNLDSNFGVRVLERLLCFLLSYWRYVQGLWLLQDVLGVGNIPS